MSEFKETINIEGKNWYLVSVNKHRIALYETILSSGDKIRRCWSEFDLGMTPKMKPQDYKIDCKIEEKPKKHLENIRFDSPERIREKLVIDYKLDKNYKKKLIYVKYNTMQKPIKEYDNLYDASLDNDIPKEKILESCKNGTKVKRFYFERIYRYD